MQQIAYSGTNAFLSRARDRASFLTTKEGILADSWEALESIPVILYLTTVASIRRFKQFFQALMLLSTSLCLIEKNIAAWQPAGSGWTQLENTQLQSACPPNSETYAFASKCAAVIYAWSGGIADTKRNRLIVWGGGHTDYSGNELYALDLASKALTRLNDPGPVVNPATQSVALADGSPNSRHTYGGLTYIAHADRMFVFGGSPATASGFASNDTWTLDLETLRWTRMDPVKGESPGHAFGVVADYDPTSKNVFLHDTQSFWQYNYDTNTYKQLNASSIDYHDSAVIDPVRKLFIIMGGGDFKVISIAARGSHLMQDWAAQSPTCRPLFTQTSPGLAYDSRHDRVLGWAGGNTLYVLNPDTKACMVLTVPNGPPGSQQANGTFGRFRYFPGPDLFAVVNDAHRDAFVLRLTYDEPLHAPKK